MYPISHGWEFKSFPLLCSDKQCAINSLVHQGSPTPGPWTTTGQWPARSQVSSRRWAAGERAKLHLPLPITPHHSSLPITPHHAPSLPITLPSLPITPHHSPSLPITPHHSHYHLNRRLSPPSTACHWWKNCLPRNRSLVPKSLGTAVVHYFTVRGSTS